MQVITIATLKASRTIQRPLLAKCDGDWFASGCPFMSDLFVVGSQQISSVKLLLVLRPPSLCCSDRETIHQRPILLMLTARARMLSMETLFN